MDNGFDDIGSVVAGLFEEWEFIRMKMDSIPPSPNDTADAKATVAIDSIEEMMRQADYISEESVRQQLYAVAISDAIRLKCQLAMQFKKYCARLSATDRTEVRSALAVKAFRCFAYIMDCVHLECACYAAMKMNDACSSGLRSLVDFVKSNRLTDSSVIGKLSDSCCYRLLSKEDMSTISDIPERVNCAVFLLGTARTSRRNGRW